MALDRNNIIVARLLKLSYCLLFAFPALPNALQSILFGAFLAICLVHFYQNKQLPFFESKNYTALFFLSTYYIFFLGTYFYPTNYHFSAEYIQPSFLLLLCPLVLFFTSWIKDKAMNKIAVWVFTICSFWSFYLLYEYWVEGIALSYKYYRSDVDFTDYTNIPDWKYILKSSTEFLNSLAEWGFYREGIKIELNTHHTFLSAVYTFNVVLILANINNKTRYYEKIMFLIVLMLLSYIIYFLESKANIICLYIILISSMIYFLLLSMSQALRYIFGVLLIAIVFTGFYYLNKNKSEYIHQIDSKRLIEPARKKLYSVLYNEVKQKPILGYGANNVKPLLDSVVKKDSSNYFFRFNVPTYYQSPHSQVLFSLLSGGYVQLGLFLIMFAFLVFVFIARGNIFGLHLVLIVGVNCVFDDFLNRVWGVYLFLVGLIYFWNDFVKKKNEINLL
jgi:hypothetical protein